MSVSDQTAQKRAKTKIKANEIHRRKDLNEFKFVLQRMQLCIYIMCIMKITQCPLVEKEEITSSLDSLCSFAIALHETLKQFLQFSPFSHYILVCFYIVFGFIVNYQAVLTHSCHKVTCLESTFSDVHSSSHCSVISFFPHQSYYYYRLNGLLEPVEFSLTILTIYLFLISIPAFIVIPILSFLTCTNY